MPEPLLFGGIGILIGHEITHGFDNRGRRYNERGLEENWWDQRTEQRFNDRTQCFVQQYGKFKVIMGEIGQNEYFINIDNII
jgi:endothelin-converting enzyme